MQRQAVIVLGVHRSGTSTTSGLMALLGLGLGKSVMDGNESNPKGFFENYRFMFFNESLLHACNVDWFSTVSLPLNWWEHSDLGPMKGQLKRLIANEFEGVNTLLFKDPRLCILLPFYLDVLKSLEIEPRFFITLRDPGQVAQSLMKRDHFTAVKSNRIWMDHMLAAEQFTRGYPRLFCDYSDVLENPVKVLQSAVSLLVPQYTLNSDVERKVIEFVEPGLNHYVTENEKLILETGYETFKLYNILRELANGSPFSKIENQLDNLFFTFYDQFRKKKHPRVGVLTFAGEDSELLKRTIFSVSNQDYINLEHVVIGNPENGPVMQVLGQFEYLISRVVHVNTKNRSVGLNLVTDMVSSEFSIILDAGTIFKDSSVVEDLVSGVINESEIIYGDTSFLDCEASLDSSLSGLPGVLFVKGMGIPVSSVLIPSSYLKNNKFNVKPNENTDFEFLFTFVTRGVPFRKICKRITTDKSFKKLTFSALKDRFHFVSSSIRLPLKWRIYHLYRLFICYLFRGLNIHH